MSWTHRDRIMAALTREEADRVAIDFGSIHASSIALKAYERLKQHLGLMHETKVMFTIGQPENVVAMFDAALANYYGEAR